MKHKKNPFTIYSELDMRPLSLVDAKNLRRGDMLYHRTFRNANGTPQRWKVNGAPQTWKTRPHEVRVPVKNGLKNCDNVTERELDLVSLACPSPRCEECGGPEDQGHNTDCSYYEAPADVQTVSAAPVVEWDAGAGQQCPKCGAAALEFSRGGRNHHFQCSQCEYAWKPTGEEHHPNFADLDRGNWQYSADTDTWTEVGG